jgi:hypothetical protein
MEEALNWVDRWSRVAGFMAPLEIRVVRPGTVEELADYAASHGALIGEYKVPRRVTAPPGAIQLLDSCVISRLETFQPCLVALGTGSHVELDRRPREMAPRTRPRICNAAARHA